MNKIIKQIKRYLNSEKVAYVESNLEPALYVCKNGEIICFYLEQRPNIATHLVQGVKIASLKEFIEEYRK